MNSGYHDFCILIVSAHRTYSIIRSCISSVCNLCVAVTVTNDGKSWSIRYFRCTRIAYINVFCQINVIYMTMSHSLFICFSLPNESDNIAKKSKTRNRKKNQQTIVTEQFHDVCAKFKAKLCTNSWCHACHIRIAVHILCLLFLSSKNTSFCGAMQDACMFAGSLFSSPKAYCCCRSVCRMDHCASPVGGRMCAIRQRHSICNL